MSRDDVGVGSADDASRGAYRLLRSSLLTGLAVVVPVVITLYVLKLAVDLFTDVVGPVVALAEYLGLANSVSVVAVEAVAAVGLFAAILAVGFVANFRYGQRAIRYFDFAMEHVPGIGAVYASFRQMSDVMLESDAENFREVKLVEFPMADAYTLGFETTRTPEEIRNAADDDEMITLFLPLAPNPVMGGFLAHVPADRVRDVDMTVEEGIRTVVTTGVGVVDAEPGSGGLSRAELERLTGADIVEAIPEEPEGGE